MSSLDESSLRQLFLDARTHRAWRPEPVPDALLHRLYELVKQGPTALNGHPTRFLFVKSPEQKAVLKEALDAGNVEKAMKAPVTVVVAVDEQFHRHLPTLSPARGAQLAEKAAAWPAAERDAFLAQNGNLEAAYLFLAARALGLDVGPMGGFNKAKVDATLLAGTGWRSLLLVNLGYGDPTPLHPRQPRLDFETAARIV